MLEEFIRIGKFLFQEGLVDSHGGNMSIREGDKIFITRRDAMLGDLKETDIVEVGLEVGELDVLASREIFTHRAIYKNINAKAVVHAHPSYAIAISITDNKIVPQDSEGIFLYKSAPIIRVRDPIGSTEAARYLIPALASGSVVAAVKGHGSFAVGKSLEEAYKYTSALENSCRILVAVRASQQKAPRVEKVEHKRAIPPGIGVMDRGRYYKR